MIQLNDLIFVGDKVVCKKLTPKESNKKILLLDTDKPKNNFGLVVKIGVSYQSKTDTITKCPVAIGDVVMVDKYVGKALVLDGEDDEYFVVNFSEIVAFSSKIVDKFE